MSFCFEMVDKRHHFLQRRPTALRGKYISQTEEENKAHDRRDDMDYSGDIFKQSMIIDGTVGACIGNSLSSPNPKRDGTRTCSNLLHSKEKPLHRYQ